MIRPVELDQGGAFGRADDDSYLASVSDLVIGLLFIFIILLMAYGFNYRQAETNQRETLTALAAERDALETERDELGLQAKALAAERDRLFALTRELEAVALAVEARHERRSTLLEEIRAYLAAREVIVSIEPENGILRLPEALLFATGDAVLRREGARAVSVLAEVLQEVLPCYSEAAPELRIACSGSATPILEAVLVEGHTDQRPIATLEFRDNWQLGAIRGINMFRALTDAQPDLEGLRNPTGQPLLGVSSYEARRPIGDPSSEPGRAQNRRIDLRFIVAAPDASDLQTLHEDASERIRQ